MLLVSGYNCFGFSPFEKYLICGLVSVLLISNLNVLNACWTAKSRPTRSLMSGYTFCKYFLSLVCYQRA